MGYRSDVAIAIDKQAFNKLRLLGKVPLVVINEIQFETGSAYYWYFQSTKWYEDFQDVKDYTALLDYLDSGPEELGTSKEFFDPDLYGFIRIGEESADYEERGAPYEFNIILDRSIRFPSPSAE